VFVTFADITQDPYFLNGIVDLRYAISCDPMGEKEIHIRTNQKVLLLAADSVPSREEWVKAIRKVIFKAQNMGDTVKVSHSTRSSIHFLLFSDCHTILRDS
jgi:sterol 3beta-glucosyltransferase